MSRICSNCFYTLEDTYNVCPKCGQRVAKDNSESNALPEGTLLNGKYLLGRVLGEGGFGITYLAWDRNLNTKIAIKEFFPNNMAIRNVQNKNTVQMLTISQSNEFAAGLKRYVKEASILSQLFNLPGIVSVKDFFYENGTAYIVMEYIDGISLKEYLKRKGGVLPYREALDIIEPIIRSLEVVHQNKLLHRDISPDNIMISNDGKVKLIDFGAARYFEGETEKSMTVVLKHGYAPLEQYSRNGVQGNWTDVYSLCAVIYRMLTGHVPTEAVDRAANQPLVPIRKYQKKVPKYIAKIVEQGLEVNIKDRWQSMSELHDELYATRDDLKRKSKDRIYSFFKKILIALILVLVLVIAGGIFVLKNRLSGDSDSSNKSYLEEVSESGKQKEEDEGKEKDTKKKTSKAKNDAGKNDKAEEGKASAENVQAVEEEASAAAEPAQAPASEPAKEQSKAAESENIEAIRNNVEVVESELDHSIVVARDGNLNGVDSSITVGNILDMFSDTVGVWTSLEDESGQIYVYYQGTRDGDTFAIEFTVFSNDTFKITGAALNGEKIEEHSSFFQSILDEVGV